MEWSRLRGRFTSGKSQGFIVLLAGLLVGIFGGILTTSTPVFAADATWSGTSLVYDGRNFTPTDNENRLSSLNIEQGSRTYINQTPPSQVEVITFESSQLNSLAEINASYAVYSFTPPDTYTRLSTSPITVESAAQNTDGLQAGQSCDIPGIGWLVCPASNAMASGMDWLYEQLTRFLKAQPLAVSDTSSGMYVAWNIMLGFANVVFIVVFLVIIYSHLTSQGITNYGIKKMLPRLIVSAVLVNVSYYICAIAIDLSNVTGQAIQDLFISIRNTMSTTGTAGEGVAVSWENVTVAILSGGAAVAGIAVVYSGVTSAAAVMLVPMLVGFLISTIVVLLVLAARQALIVILTIISPLAFVAYLLPGTEKWFGKWRDTFFTMLIFFPAFSAVFGGSQLAGAAIIQNSTDIIMAVLGLAVQVAPLAIAPLILKLSGGLLNRFAGIINNPSKGLVDRSRKLADDWSQELVNRRSRANDKLPKHALMRRAGRSLYHRQQRRKERIDNYQKKADAAYKATTGHAALDKQRREVEMGEQLTQKQLDVDWNKYLNEDARAKEIDLKVRIKADEVELSGAKLDNRYQEFRAGHHPDGFIGPLQASDPTFQIMKDAQDTAQGLAVEGLRKNNAQRVLNNQLADNMLRSQDLQKAAGGIYEFGQEAALASALNTMRSEYGKSVEEGRQIVKHFNLSGEQRQKHALGEAVTVTDSLGNERTFDATNTFTREAVIEDQIAVGTVEQVKQIVELSGSELAAYKTTISDAIARSGVKGKAPFMGGKLIDDIARGAIKSEEQLIGYIQDWIADGKYRDEDVAITDPQGLELLMKAATSSTASMSPKLQSQLGEGLSGLSKKAQKVLSIDELNIHVSKKAQPLMEKISRGDFTP